MDNQFNVNCLKTDDLECLKKPVIKIEGFEVVSIYGSKRIRIILVILNARKQLEKSFFFDDIRHKD